MEIYFKRINNKYIIISNYYLKQEMTVDFE